MTEIENQYNWNKLAEEGDSYDQIRIELDALEVGWYGLQKEKVFTEEGEFTKGFKQEINAKVDQIFESCPLSKNDIASMKRKFHAGIKDSLKLVLLKKGLAQITFDQYPLFKFFEVFNTNIIEFLQGKSMIIG